MLKTIKKLLTDNAILIAVLITVSIAVGSLVRSGTQLSRSLQVSDKTIHLVAYFSLMLFWLYAFFKKRSFQENVKYLVLGCMFFGTIIEILQPIVTSDRTASFLDVVANATGILFAVIIFHFFEKKINFFGILNNEPNKNIS